MPKATGQPTVFLDANVLFSAAYRRDGRCALVVRLGEGGLCHLYSSSYALVEAERNLQIKKPQALKELDGIIKHIYLLPEANNLEQNQAKETGLNDADAPVLASAIGKTNYFVTGDRRHFGSWMGKEVLGLKIISPAMFLKLFLPL